MHVVLGVIFVVVVLGLIGWAMAAVSSATLSMNKNRGENLLKQNPYFQEKNE